VSSVDTDAILRENLKLILNLVVDDVYKNYDNYSLQKKVLEQNHPTATVETRSKEKGVSRDKASNADLVRSSVHSALNRDFIEPAHGKSSKS
jgi:hypothetical protein